MKSSSLILPLILFTPMVQGIVEAQSPRLAEHGKRALPAGTQHNPAVAHADIDGDGDQDLILSGGGVRVFLNDGKAQFAESLQGALPNTENTAQIIAEDFTGDGLIDLFLAKPIRSNQPGMLFRGLGNGQFNEITTIANLQLSQATWISGAAAGDLNGDGLADLALAKGDEVTVLLNAKPGSFSSSTRIAIPFTSSVSLGDLDGDGDLDLIVGSLLSKTLLRYSNDGTGKFTAGTPALILNSNLDALKTWLVDLDRDGDVDLVAMNKSQHSIALNNGSGTFFDVSSTWLKKSLVDTRITAVQDFDGDGYPDLIASNDDRSFFMKNTGSAFLDFPEQSPRMPSLDGVTADFMGNGSQVTILATQGLHIPQVLHLVPTGFGTKTWVNTNARAFPFNDGTMDLTTGDFDGDGKTDLVSIDLQGVHLHTNPRGRSMERHTILAGPVQVAGAGLTTGDFDGDGDLDLIVSGHSRILLINQGRGSFTQQPLGTEFFVTKVVSADIDRDGDLDCITTTEILLNDGSARFVSSQVLIPVPAPHVEPLVGDVDNDGDQDVVMVGTSTELFRNDGTGKLGKAEALSALNFSIANRAALHDLDGDGDLDLVASTDSRTVLLINNGTGKFSEQSTNKMPAHQGIVTGLRVVDIDSDGDEDLWLGRRKFGDLVFENDGSGSFTASGTTWINNTGIRARYAASGDFDDDGDTDLVISYESSANVLHTSAMHGMVLLQNRERHLNTPRFTRNGGSLQVDYFVGSGSARLVLPWIDLRMVTPISIPGIGTLHLDPASAITLPTVKVSLTTGKASANYPLPMVSAQANITLAIQAAVLHDASLSSVRLTAVILERVNN